MVKEKILITKIEPVIAELFIEGCKAEGKTVNRKLGEIIEKETIKTGKPFFSGKNKIQYNKSSNSFDWYADLDNGQRIPLLNNLSTDFLKNLKEQIEVAQRDRIDWLNLKDNESVEIPNFKGDEK